MAISVDKTKFERITLAQQRAFAYRNKSGYEFEFDEEGNWVAPPADIGSNDSISIPSVIGLSDAQKAGLALSIDQNLQNYHKRLTNQERGNISPQIQFSLEGEQVIIELKTETNPPLYSEFVIQIASLTNENGEPQQAGVELKGTWDIDSYVGDTSSLSTIDDYLIAFNEPRGAWDSEGYHYNDQKYGAERFWSSIEEAKAKQREVSLTLDQQRLLMERSKAALSFEFDKNGFWLSEISYKSPLEAFAALLGDYDRASITYGNETILRNPEFKKAIEEEKQLLTESNRLNEEKAKYNGNHEKLAEIEREREKLQLKLDAVAKKMEAAQPKPSELSQPERIKLLLQDQLGLTEEQAIGFAYSIGQQLYGYHKRLIGLGQEAGDDQDIPYTVKFSRVSEKIVAELHTETDPKLYSRFEIAVSELTNELGQPQQARVRLDSTISSNSPEGEWQEDGYHYRSAAKARLFWPSIEEKQAAVEKRQTVDAKEERTTTKQISSTDKTTLFEMIGPMLLLAKAFTLVKEVVSDFVKYMESQPNTNEASVPTPVASSSVIEKSTADSQNRYGMFAMIGAVGKMVMNAISLEAVNRSLGPKA